MKLSVIIPCYNEADNLKELYQVITKEFTDLNYELIFINDGSKDQTYKIINELYENDPDHVKGINLSRNFGKEAAMYAGLVHAKGKYTCILDADLQQHPKYVMEMVKYLDNHESIDQVTMYIKNRKDSFIKKIFVKLFYKLMDKTSDVKFVENASDFRTFRSNVRSSILELSEVNRFSKGIFSWVGFNTEYLPYDVNKRYAGKSSFNFTKLVKYAIDAFIDYSTSPLRIITKIGFGASFFAFIYMIIVIVKKLFYPATLGGYTSLIAVVLFFSSIQIFFLGIIGEYLAKTYFETKKRPIYLTKDKIGFDEDNIL